MRFLALFSLLVASAFLRPPVAVVGPLLPTIGADLSLTPGWLSVLGAIPVFGFGLGAFVTPRLAERFDARRLLRWAVALLLVALIIRSSGGSFALFVGTILIGLTIAVGNTVLPSIVRSDFPDRVGFVTGLYSTTLAGSAAIASWLAVPMSGTDGSDWRFALVMPAAIGILALLSSFLPNNHKPEPGPHPPRVVPLLRQARAWRLSAFMGVQSTVFYSTLTWLPSFLISAGYTTSEAGAWLSYSGLLGLPVGLLLPVFLNRASLSSVAVGASAVALVGAVALALFPGTQLWLWLALLGLGQGLAFPLGLAAIAASGEDQAATTALSAMAQGVGYLTAGVGTFAIGLIQGWTGSWAVAMLCFAGVGLVQLMLAPRLTHGDPVTAR